MSVLNGLWFLRPYLYRKLRVRSQAAYVRFFNSTLFCEGRQPAAKVNSSELPDVSIEDTAAFRSAVQDRIKELRAANALTYPRIDRNEKYMTCAEFVARYAISKVPAHPQHEDIVLVRGRINGFRVAGKGLVFVDIIQDDHLVQGTWNLTKLTTFGGVTNKDFQRFYKSIRRGDIISILGNPYANRRGQICINAVDIPEILSPSLASLPTKLDDLETRIRNRHVDLLVNKSVADVIRLRSHVIQYVRNFLLQDKFLEVQTPIIADSAGGAIAKPFRTFATEFADKKLALRIAPELWLKRLILGGLDRVFEIGPVFRNEGLDATHNPEFTTCEFYKSFADLEELISMTEEMITGLALEVLRLREESLTKLPPLDPESFTSPFKRIQFIPAVEEALGERLPDLSAGDAAEQLILLLAKHNISIPATPTLPRLLDKLSSIYLEPQCTAPTFIMHHPACLAPLSKSFLDPNTKQFVSARVELFIQNHEIANMYEEENSPFEQRAKLLEQIKYKDEENSAMVDESYLEALEWGLPPTGGWGCGLDRLVMLFAGTTRIGDVLAFGSLRNVVNLGKSGKE